nr:hypothetical protein [uncultured bacterium]
MASGSLFSRPRRRAQALTRHLRLNDPQSLRTERGGLYRQACGELVPKTARRFAHLRYADHERGSAVVASGNLPCRRPGRRPRRRLQRSFMPQGRRSRLIIRRVDPWTILKFSVLLYLSMYFVVLVAGIVLWTVATATGVRGNIESFLAELIASDQFKFEAPQILRSSVIGGALLVVIGCAANLLMAVLFNLISDVVGGIGISVEERPPRRRRRRAQESPVVVAAADGTDQARLAEQAARPRPWQRRPLRDPRPPARGSRSTS